MSQPFKLHRLQQIDSQLDQVNNHLREIEITLSDNLPLREAKEKYSNTEVAYAAARKELRKAEEAVQSQRIKINQTESTLYGGKVRNPKELQDLQNESLALSRYLDVLEDRQLEAMIVLEQAELEHNISEQELNKTRVESEIQNQELRSEQRLLEQEKNRLEIERHAAASALLKDELQLYHQLRKIRQGVAVARVVDNCCSACGSTLSSAQLHAARSLNQIIRCDSCSRILYGGT